MSELGVAVLAQTMREECWSFPPDYVSAETLAYRLDCSRSTIDTYVRMGVLPKPETIGKLQRWDFRQVVAFIKLRNTVDAHNVNVTVSVDEEDAYSKGLKDGAPKKKG